MGDVGSLLSELAPIGARPDGGVDRFSWTEEDRALRSWFDATASAIGLTVEADGNGNQWAWWGCPGPGAVVTGSHLDSVPGGGRFDGPLGVASALVAVERLRRGGHRPAVPVAVTNFVDEEGARFGVACLGSRLLTGTLDPGAARALTDAAGTTLASAVAAFGDDPSRLGPDPARLALVGSFVELHVEQGRRLVDLGAPVGVATAIWPHGRWRLRFTGSADHAGTTRMADRHDPMLPFAATVLAARRVALDRGAHATVGKVVVTPNATNGIAARVDAWLDARAASAEVLDAVVDEVRSAASDAAGPHGVTVEVDEQSRTGAVGFGADLRTRIAATLGGAPELPTAAGHDAGVISSQVPAAMLFVRNPTGTSHSPAEHATPEDCEAGVDALTAVLADLTTRR